MGILHFPPILPTYGRMGEWWIKEADNDVWEKIPMRISTSVQKFRQFKLIDSQCWQLVIAVSVPLAAETAVFSHEIICTHTVADKSVLDYNTLYIQELQLNPFLSFEEINGEFKMFFMILEKQSDLSSSSPLIAHNSISLHHTSQHLWPHWLYTFL